MRFPAWLRPLLVMICAGAAAPPVIAADAPIYRRWERPQELPPIPQPAAAFVADPTFARAIPRDAARLRAANWLFGRLHARAARAQLRRVTDVARVEELAAADVDVGFMGRAIAILDEAIARDPDPERACRARVLLLRAELTAGTQRDRLAAARALATAARGTAHACRAEADALIGGLAFAYHLEASGCHAFSDPRRTALALWDLEVELATTRARRAAALRDRALMFWQLAEDDDGRHAAAWAAAADAADRAAAIDPSDVDLVRRADDARHNQRWAGSL